MSVNYQELDRSSWWGESEPSMWAVTTKGSVSTGETYAAAIKQLLSFNGRSLSSSARYLGLAAGDSYAEMAFARKLGIKAGNITLVDKGFSLDTLSRLRQGSPKSEVVTSGLFTYLAQAEGQHFDLITAFGIEYVLNKRKHFQAFLTLASKIINPGALVTLAPTARVYKVTEFTLLREDDDALFLTFSGQPVRTSKE